MKALERSVTRARDMRVLGICWRAWVVHRHAWSQVPTVTGLLACNGFGSSCANPVPRIVRLYGPGSKDLACYVLVL